MKPPSLLLAVVLGLATAVSAAPAAVECWFVEDGGSLAKKPAALLLRPGREEPPPRPDLDPKLYLSVHDPTGALQAAFRRYPRDAPAPHCEMSGFVPFPASANWASSLTPDESCPRALDGTWFTVSMSSPVLRLSCLLRPQPEPQQKPVPITLATVVLTVLTHTPTSQIRLGHDAMLDLSFAYMPLTPEATSPTRGPPPFGLEWRRQHLGKGRLLLATTPGLHGQKSVAREGAVAFAAWDDDEPWGPWTGNGTLRLPAVQPFQEGTYLATIHLPYLQGQVTLELAVYKPPKVSLMPAPLVWAAPGEAPRNCSASRPTSTPPRAWSWSGNSVAAQRAFLGRSGARSGSPPCATTRMALSASLGTCCRPRPLLSSMGHAMPVVSTTPVSPASGRSAEVTLEVAGLSGPSLEDGVGLFLSAFLLLGLFKALGWIVANSSISLDSKQKKVQ